MWEILVYTIYIIFNIWGWSVTLPPKTRPRVYISEAENCKVARDVMSEYFPLLELLSKCGEIKYVDSEKDCPEGCLMLLSKNNI